MLSSSKLGASVVHGAMLNGGEQGLERTDLAEGLGAAPSAYCRCICCRAVLVAVLLAAECFGGSRGGAAFRGS